MDCSDKVPIHVGVLFCLPFLIVAVAVLSRILHYPDFANPNTALCLEQGRLVLDGKLPYIDFINLQPPFIYYIFVPPALIARWTGGSLLTVGAFFSWLLIIYSIGSSFLVLRKQTAMDQWVLLLPVLFGFSIINLPGFVHYGQKDYIFVLVLLPFVFLRWLRREDKAFSIMLSTIIGTILGASICLKPTHFIFIPVLLEVYWSSVKKQKIVNKLANPEIIACLGVMIIYLLWFIVGVPEAMRAAFLYRWMPLTIAGYADYFSPLGDLFLLRSIAGTMVSNYWSMVLVCVVAVLIRKQHQLIMPLLIWTVTGWLMYLEQRKGWPYQLMIMLSGYFMLANLELGILAKWIIGRKLYFIDPIKRLWGQLTLVFALYCTILCLTLPWLIRDSFSMGMAFNPLNQAIAKFTHRGDSVLVVSRFTTGAYPLLIQSGRKAASRYLWTFPLHMCRYLQLRAKDSATQLQYENEEKRVILELREDAIKTHPRLIAISLFPTALENDYTWKILYLLKQDGFDEVLKDYRPIGLWNRCPIWIRRN